MKALFGMGALLMMLPLTASAEGRLVGELQRNMARLAKTQMGGERITLFSKGGYSLQVVPRTGVIATTRHYFKQTGYGIMGDKISATQSKEIERHLLRKFPRLDRKGVLKAFTSAISSYKQRQRTLKQQDPLVDQLLQRAGSLRQNKTLWKGSHGSVAFKPERNYFVLYGGSGTRGLEAYKGANGLTLAPDYRNTLRSFLAANK